jgi:hypothetical protein
LFGNRFTARLHCDDLSGKSPRRSTCPFLPQAARATSNGQSSQPGSKVRTNALKGSGSGRHREIARPDQLTGEGISARNLMTLRSSGAVRLRNRRQRVLTSETLVGFMALELPGIWRFFRFSHAKVPFPHRFCFDPWAELHGL